MRRVFTVWGVFDIRLTWNQGVLIGRLQDRDGFSFRSLCGLFSIKGALVFLVFCDAGLRKLSEHVCA